MEDVRNKRAMLLCLVLILMLSLGIGAVSAIDSNDCHAMESNQDLTVSDSINENNNIQSNVLSDSINGNIDIQNNVKSDSINGNIDIESNVLSDSIDLDDENDDDYQISINQEDLKSNVDSSLNSNVLNDDSNVIYVSPNGNDENDGLTRETPVGNISKAVSIAGEGSTIILLSGVYNQDKNTQLSKNLYFVGENGAIINRTAKLAVFTYTSDNLKTVSFKNIVFISESTSATNPILSMAAHANLICDNCTFTNVIATRNGIVRFMGNATGTISNCRFTDLHGTTTGGSSYVYVLGEAKVRVNNCIFANISNTFLRAVIYVNNDLANLTLTNSHFYNISGNANAVVENRGYLNITSSRFNDIALSGNSPEGIVWTSETINKNSRTYINSSSFYNNSINTEVAVNSSIIQAKSPVVVEYSSFIGNDVDFIVNNDNKTNITANYNWWGTNDNPKSLLSDDVTIENWFIMTVDFDSNNLIAGEEYPIGININQVTNENGESYYLDEGITGAEVIVSSQNGNFRVNGGTMANGIPLGGGILEEAGKIAKVYTNNGFVSLIYAPAIDGLERISFKSGYQEFVYNIVLAEAIVYNDYYVSKSGSDENDGLTVSTAFKTISHAIETAKSLRANAKIHISSGVYEENGLEIDSYGSGFESPHFAFLGNGTVAIDGKGQGISIFTIRDGAVSFKNIRFTNVNGADNGGAINVASSDDSGNPSVNLTLNNCTFDNLLANGNGGAINYESGSGKIDINNTRFHNLGSNANGGAIYIKEGELANLKITRSNFKDNIANNGGALFLELSNITIANCDFINNTANNCAGSMAFYNASVIVENCVIANGSSKKQATAILIDNENGNAVTIKSSTIENNTGIVSDGGIGAGVDDEGIIASGGSGTDGDVEENYAIYVMDGTADISYCSIFNDLSLATAEGGSASSQAIAIANNNWWGTNNPNETVKGSNIIIDKWLILHVTLNNTGVLKVGNSVNVTIDFNHVMTSSGEILPLTGGIISREFAIRMNATAGRIYPYYLVTRDKEASSTFTVQDGGASLDIRTENALVHIDFIVNNYYGVIYISNFGNDDWNGSIESPVRTYQKAISLALEEGGSHHIFFLEGTYEFYGVNVDETYLTIEGEGIDKSILDGEQYTGGMISSYESELIIKNITLRNGANTVSSGGTITNMGNLTLDTVKVSDSIVKNANGGAIYSVGHLTIINSTFSNNLVNSGASGGSGGVIYTDGYYSSLDYYPSLEIYDSEFIGNFAKGGSFGGGAIYMQVVNGNKVIKNTKFINNNAVAGGAIFMQRSEGDFIMDNVSFIGNKATGSASIYGGGAICLIGISDSRVGNVSITNSLFENNSAKNTLGGGAIFDRNVDLNISNSIILNNKDNDENLQIYKHTTIYLPSGGRISLEDNWWGTNDLSALSTLASNVTINRWVVMDLSAEVNDNAQSSPSDLNLYSVKVSLDKYSDGTSIKDSLNHENYYPFERPFELMSSTGTFNPESGILAFNIGESIFTSSTKDNAIIAKIDNQSLELNTMDLYVNTEICLELENNPINTRHTNLNISLNGIDSNPINGTIILSINGNEKIIDIIDGKATVEINGLNEGINNITAIFNGKGKYLESSSSCLLEVKLTNVVLSLIADDAVVGESSNVKVLLFDEFNNPINLTVNVSANDKIYPVQVEDGIGSLALDPIYETGKYRVIASFECDEYEGNTYCEAVFTVYGPGNVTIKHSDDGDALDIQRAIDSASPGDIIQLGSYSYHDVADINITKDIAIAGSEGTVIESCGNGKPIFNAISKSENGPDAVNITGIDFKLNNGDIVLKAFAQNDTDNNLSIDTQAISITGNVFETADESVVPESINVLYLESPRGVLVPNNEIRICDNTISAGINPFKFEVSSAVSGNDANIIPLNITPEKKATVIHYENMNTTAVDQSVDGRVGEYFNFKLTDSEGNPIANTPMQIGFLGVVYDESYGIITDENGVAKLQINLGWKNDYTFAICFLGNDEYNASFAVAKINVAPQKGSLTVPNKSYSASAKTKTLTATFKSASGKPVAGKTIKFTVNGKTYSAKTNDKGVASVNVSLSKKGTYSFTAKFATNGMYATMTKTAKLLIK